MRLHPSTPQSAVSFMIAQAHCARYLCCKVCVLVLKRALCARLAPSVCSLLRMPPQILGVRELLSHGSCPYRAGTAALVLEGALNVRHEAVRRTTVALLQRLACTPAGHAWALRQLERRLADADAAPHHCADFYRLFCELVAAIPNMPAEVRARAARPSAALRTCHPSTCFHGLRSYTSRACHSSYGSLL